MERAMVTRREELPKIRRIRCLRHAPRAYGIRPGSYNRIGWRLIVAGRASVKTPSCMNTRTTAPIRAMLIVLCGVASALAVAADRMAPMPDRHADPWLWSTGDFKPDRGWADEIPGTRGSQAKRETA